MEQSLSFVESVERMKKKLFSPSADLFALFPVSAYDTAWMAIVPNPNDPTQPMFPECLDWIMRNQNATGFWVDDHHELINYKHQWSGDDLMATLTCLIALKTWEITGFSHKINKGLKFLRDNMEKELIKMRKSKEGGDEADLRRWFLMIELAKAKGLKVINNEIFDEFKLNGIMLKGEEGEMMERVVLREMSFESGGSALFRSPSVTACAFMVTGDEVFKTYLQHLITNCQHGVPPIYLTDKDIIKFFVVDHLERLGCAEHFTEEINEVMDHQYRKWIVEESQVPKKDDAAFQIYKDSLAFRLLRMRGYQVSPNDFFDEKGSLHELSILTDAIQRWQGECLTSHSKVIFTVVENLVHDIALKSFKQHGHDVKKILQNSWKEIFKSWLKEAEWSKSSHYPSIDQYIEIARISIAVEMIIIPTCYLINSKIALEEHCLDISNTMITKSLMILCRLLNDLESYEKEAKVRKPNIVLLYLKENPKAKIEDAIAFVRYILEKEKKEFLRLVMSRHSEGSDMPREWKDLHLSSLKVFQMFFNSTNVFDSPTVLLKNINKAIYEPLMVKETTSQPVYFINKELKLTNTKAPYKKVKINRASNKSALLSFDLNKRLYPWTYKKLHKPSFACNIFMEGNYISYKSVL